MQLYEAIKTVSDLGRKVTFTNCRSRLKRMVRALEVEDQRFPPSRYDVVFSDWSSIVTFNARRDAEVSVLIHVLTAMDGSIL